MLLSAFKIKFIEKLRGKYPPEEISSFFNLLTEAYLDMSRLQVALAPDRRLNEKKLEDFEKALKALERHQPIQYILGETEFFGLPFKVEPAVLIPRPETEELVDWILSDYKGRAQKGLRILDIGTGSGCIAISLAANLPEAKISGMDISAEALEVAGENARRIGVEIDFLQEDVLQLETLASRYDLIVSNPPYVRELEKKKMEANVLEHEPGLALWVKDEDPLLFYERITRLAGRGLHPEGALYFEINEVFGKETRELLEENNFRTSLKKDIFGKDRMIKGIKE